MNPKTKQSMIDIIKSCDTVQLATFGLGKYPESRIIMNALNKEIENLDLHFITSNKSHKYAQIKNNSNVCLYYFNPNTHMSIRLFGTIITHEDAESREKFWNDNWTVYGYTDVNDPNYSVLEFKPESYKFYEGTNEVVGIIE